MFRPFFVFIARLYEAQEGVIYVSTCLPFFSFGVKNHEKRSKK